MNDDDLLEPKLSSPPATAPITRGRTMAVVTVSLAVLSACSSTIGRQAVFDTGIRANDAGQDAGACGVLRRQGDRQQQ